MPTADGASILSVNCILNRHECVLGSQGRDNTYLSDSPTSILCIALAKEMEAYRIGPLHQRCSLRLQSSQRDSDRSLPWCVEYKMLAASLNRIHFSRIDKAEEQDRLQLLHLL